MEQRPGRRRPHQAEDCGVSGRACREAAEGWQMLVKATNGPDMLIDASRVLKSTAKLLENATRAEMEEQ